ncbi:hypothetical protein GQ457_02G035350 [Hibiscus cannabinus]
MPVQALHPYLPIKSMAAVILTIYMEMLRINTGRVVGVLIQRSFGLDELLQPNPTCIRTGSDLNLLIEAVVSAGGCSNKDAQIVHQKSTAQNNVPNVTSKDKIVSVVTGEDQQVLRERNGRSLPGSLRARKNDTRGIQNPLLAGRISALTLELDQAKQTEHEGLTSTLARIVSDPVHVTWHENSSFTKEGNDTMQENQSHDVFALMEPRISGSVADAFIRKSGYAYSYRVEASGFSGGIWVMWRNTVYLDILAVSRQFVHGFCTPTNGDPSFFVTFVYASPNVAQRCSLWNRLKALEPDVGWPQGGSSSRVEVVHLQRFGSDHRHLLLDTDNRSSERHAFELERSLKTELDMFFLKRKVYDTKNIALIRLRKETEIPRTSMPSRWLVGGEIHSEARLAQAMRFIGSSHHYFDMKLRPLIADELDHRFSTKSAYASLVVEASTVSSFNWKLIWSLKLLQRVKMFLWLVAHQCLLTNAERCQRHLASSDLCSICNQDSEIVDHVLRKCFVTKRVWQYVIAPDKLQGSYALSFLVWFDRNIRGAGTFTYAGGNWATRFSVICWLLWKCRCSFLFDENFFGKADLVSVSQQLSINYAAAFSSSRIGVGVE